MSSAEKGKNNDCDNGKGKGEHVSFGDAPPGEAGKHKQSDAKLDPLQKAGPRTFNDTPATTSNMREMLPEFWPRKNASPVEIRKLEAGRTAVWVPKDRERLMEQRVRFRKDSKAAKESMEGAAVDVKDFAPK